MGHCISYMPFHIKYLSLLQTVSVETEVNAGGVTAGFGFSASVGGGFGFGKCE